MKKSQIQVLIVGAGPTGLAAACALSKFGISHRIIDKGLARSDKSKALGVQAGTLECLSRGLDPKVSQQMVTAGRPTFEAWIHLNDQRPLKVNLRTINSQHNYILILEQSETERILEEYLEGFSQTVERKTELLTIIDKGSEVISTVRGTTGEIEEIVSDFVVGCDGAHSATRHLMQIPFKGAAYTGNFILGDVKLKWKFPYDSVHTFVSQRGVIASFPLRDDGRYRLILIPKGKVHGGDKSEISFEEFSSIVSHLSQNQISISEATWLTRFRVHHRMVESYQKGRVFLAGDAAHIHSPAGGQGMNIGIQDALNLAFKLKSHLSGIRSFASLSDYQKERLPIAKQVLRGTDLVFRMALMPENPLASLMRRFVLPTIVGSNWIQRRVVNAMSEVSMAKSEIARYDFEQ